MEAYILKVFGRVQRVGFRRYVLDSAQELGLTGYAKNLPDGSIEIFVQGDVEGLSKFLEIIKQPMIPAKIKEIIKEETNPKPEIKEFKIIYGELIEELQEGFGAMQSIFADYWREFRDYRQEFKDYRQEFRDYRQEFRDFRQEFRDYRQEFKDYRQEFKDYREEFRDFVRRTDENFKLILDKYGEISEKLTIILET
ncbi:acylphosphatase, partial [Candidatus Bathyarchaeota archaeon]|nr:acylphosphatase [Candidatus Bathyarchaeota archaeon]